jgi:hypothetical protein
LRSKLLTPPDHDDAESTPINSYIGSVAQQMAAKAAIMPLEAVVQQAEQTLATSPVPSYPGFTPEEIRALAAYRCQFLAGDSDTVWKMIVAGGPETWMVAIHEAAEIEAYCAAGIDFLDPIAWKRRFAEMHILACIAEARFLKAWATHLGYNTTELALEINHPIRKPFRAHRSNVTDVQHKTGWDWPDEVQELKAVAFFKRILP